MKKLKNKLSQIKKKLGALNVRASFVFLTVLVLVVVGLIAAGISSTVSRVSPNMNAGILGFEIVPAQPRHPLTGEKIDKRYETLPQVFAIMVENSADAWPIRGIEEAFLVIEAPAEGDIPRFITFFSDEAEVEKLGPVRSARPYYVEWATAFDAVYGHVGGSPEGLDLIASMENFLDLNQFYQSEYYWRQTTNGRYAPHNVFTSAKRFISSLDELQPPTPEYEYFTFKDDAPVDEGAKSISIDWSSGSTYDVDWEYRSETNDYFRTQGGSEYIANNVVVMATDIRVIDEKGRKKLVTIGEGDALFAQDGEVFLGRWKKTSADGPLKFFTHAGDEISFNAGKTWIEVVRGLDQVDIVEN